MWEGCHSELTVLHTEQLQPEPGTAVPHTWSRGRTGLQEPEAQLTLPTQTHVKGISANAPHLPLSMDQEHSCNQVCSPANTQECSIQHNALCCWTPGVMASEDVQVPLCYPYKHSPEEADPCAVHPTVVMYVGYNFSSCFSECPAWGNVTSALPHKLLQ